RGGGPGDHRPPGARLRRPAPGQSRHSDRPPHRVGARSEPRVLGQPVRYGVQRIGPRIEQRMPEPVVDGTGTVGSGSTEVGAGLVGVPGRVGCPGWLVWVPPPVAGGLAGPLGPFRLFCPVPVGGATVPVLPGGNPAATGSRRGGQGFGPNWSCPAWSRHAQGSSRRSALTRSSNWSSSPTETAARSSAGTGSRSSRPDRVARCAAAQP